MFTYVQNVHYLMPELYDTQSEKQQSIEAHIKGEKASRLRAVCCKVFFHQKMSLIYCTERHMLRRRI